MLSILKSNFYYHEATNHSYTSVAIDPNYVDSTTQPICYKVYPKFYRRFPLDDSNKIHSFIELTSKITFEKTYRNETYQRRINPSAGALYPTEIYVQIRGIKGLIDGIYHLEIPTNSLTLIYELINDGLESYICPGFQVKGLIFLVTCVYFRSSWKYKNRSFRYCLLDSGHHLGAIEASAYIHSQDFKIIFDFDKLALNQDLGFENKELATVAVVSGEIKQRNIQRLHTKIPFVSGTDYFEANEFVEKAYQNTLVFNSYPQTIKPFDWSLDRSKLLEAVVQRRSARALKKESITKSEFLSILEVLDYAIVSKTIEKLETYILVHQVTDMTPGIYYKDKLLKAGEFRKKAAYLCLNQTIASHSAVTLFFVASYQSYQTAMQIAGLLGQRIYLISHYLGLKCSGIGAYYDEEVKEVLETDKDILYGMAVGK